MARFVDVVEGVEKFDLRALLAGDKLNVVHKQKIQLAVLVAQLLTGVCLYGGNNVVGEILTGDKQYVVLGVLFVHVVAYGMQKMRLAQADAAVDEKGVISL